MGWLISANQAEGGYKSAGKGVSQTDLIPLNKSSKITSSFELNNCLADENSYFPRRTGIDFFNRFDEDLALNLSPLHGLEFFPMGMKRHLMNRG
ncbi:hypothetical protein [Leuconostoc mesenteroides]|uniref:hypothetical protein n=1 Tax=Leuconostoc mesenteroides TaxID=1245 RepID=UPI00235FE4E8|nr:hypothetical protein [Leuconostoc mesenteroides]